MIINIIKLLRLKGALIRLLAIILFFVLWVFKRYRKIVFYPIIHHRIGHLAINTDLFLRRLRNGCYPSSNIYIGVSKKGSANRQILKMLQRHLFIISSNLLRDIIAVYPLRESEFYYELPFNGNEYYEFNNMDPILSFSKEEQQRGKQMLADMGIGENDWFVCFFSRDSAYLNMDINNKQGDWGYHDYRNSDVNNYMAAAEYIAKQGGFAVRMGNIVNKSLPKKRHPRIIDYATDFRSDFMDIYLSANCKYFVGDNCGIMSVAQIFNIPTAWANVVPINHIPLLHKDRFMPKKMRLKRESRLLTFKEIIEHCYDFMLAKQYEEAGIDVLENNSDDILDLVVEMNELMDGKIRYFEEDEKNQKEFKTLFSKIHACYGFPSRIGNNYLKKYKGLLN